MKKLIRDRFFRNVSLPSHGVRPYYGYEFGPRSRYIRFSWGGYRAERFFVRYPGINTSFHVGVFALSFVKAVR
jgi:hypothetical protein